jgi:hypothetical protein
MRIGSAAPSDRSISLVIRSIFIATHALAGIIIIARDFTTMTTNLPYSYAGDWCAAIVRRYDPHVHVFEPIAEFADLITKRFGNNRKLHV